ncbi:hypothetical protein KDH_79790 [Dictyobacter sp. S3.2.2.5]|uniref:Cation/H+ exchanger domain-containing protein n=1 Tax=Dictyobacter halimunensis TaxID=3026934 RepID=A0ABQ6G6G9_9CHLR|nr:hypothetical protein KDH_79790 [Dictyobacter sp. S3.2.2.5]
MLLRRSFVVDVVYNFNRYVTSVEKEILSIMIVANDVVSLLSIYALIVIKRMKFGQNLACDAD